MRRCIVRLSSINKLFEYVAKPPTHREHSWERLAHKIKGIPTEREKASREERQETKGDNYVPSLQREFSAEDSLGKLQEELQEEMAFALGKTGAKCMHAFRQLKIAEEQFNYARRSSPLRDRRAAAKAFNVSIREADDARRELVIHRQACGFTHRNHQIVASYFPLPALVRVTSWEAALALSKLSSNKKRQMRKRELRAVLLELCVDELALAGLSKDQLVAVLERELEGN